MNHQITEQLKATGKVRIVQTNASGETIKEFEDFLSKFPNGYFFGVIWLGGVARRWTNSVIFFFY